MSPNKLRKRYVETSRGLVHLQESGTPGRPALALITLTSFSAPAMDRVLPALADQGWHAVALDLMGYGRSDKREGHWRVEDFADNMIEALQAASIEPVGMACGHFASWTGIEIAARKALPSLRGLALDGTPRFTPEERAAKLAEGPPAPQPWDTRGTHALAYWDKVWRIINKIDPDRPLDAVPTRRYRDAVMSLMEASVYEPNTAMAAAWFEIEKRVALVDVPTLVVCADTDWNLKHHEWMLASLPRPTSLRLAGVNPVHAIDSPERAPEYAAHLHEFFSRL